MDWLDGKYTLDQMTTIVAWNRSHKLVAMHASDAEAKEMARKNRGGGEE